MATGDSIRFTRVTLQAPVSELAETARFYEQRLGFGGAPDGGRLTVGETELSFEGVEADAFYHFALLVPGNRFSAALSWIGRRAELLPDPRSGEVVFDFPGWRAHACYFHDPARNIVELIAHRDVGTSERRGEFAATELLGFSELGLVGEPAAMAASLEREVGLEVWDGTTIGPSELSFVGSKARTLILAPPARGWLPTARSAEPFGADVEIAGGRRGEALLQDGRYRVRCLG